MKLKKLETKFCSLIFPEGWTVDFNQKPLAIYRKDAEGGVIQISSWTNESGKNPGTAKDRLSNFLEKKKSDIKIKTYKKKDFDLAVSDYYSKSESGEWYNRDIVALSKHKMAFITYTVKYSKRKERLKEAERILKSFSFPE